MKRRLSGTLHWSLITAAEQLTNEPENRLHHPVVQPCEIYRRSNSVGPAANASAGATSNRRRRIARQFRRPHSLFRRSKDSTRRTEEPRRARRPEPGSGAIQRL